MSFVARAAQISINFTNCTFVKGTNARTCPFYSCTYQYLKLTWMKEKFQLKKTTATQDVLGAVDL